MIYLDWFEAVQSLLRREQEGQILLNDSERRTLSFLGEFFDSRTMSILRLLDPCPKSFDLESPVLGNRPDLFNENFQLPSRKTVVEDEFSAIAYADLEAETTGIQRKRIYLHIDYKRSDGSVPLRSLQDVLRFMDFQASVPDKTFFVFWGVMEVREGLRIDGVATPVFLTPFGMMIFQENTIPVLQLSEGFRRIASLPCEGKKIEQDEEALATAMNSFGADLVQNLQFGLLQIAYANGIEEQREK